MSGPVTRRAQAKTRESVAAGLAALRVNSAASPSDFALIIAGAMHQARLSPAGIAIADALGVKRPPNLYELDAKARELGLNPREIWPHLKISKGVNNA